jgi:heterodisulfide reductase subunit C2
MADATLVPSSRFAEEIQAKSQQQINLCYQCKKCAAGCPMSFVMSPYNSDLLKSIQLGAKEAVLKSNTIWLCVACKTCAARCPNGIDISKIMDVLREMALAEGIVGCDRKTPVFHSSFLTTVEQLGRSYEAGVIGLYKLKTASFTSDIGLGFKFMAKNKLKLLPDRIKRLGEIKQIFRKAKEEHK